jgi:hypothetical protein
LNTLLLRAHLVQHEEAVDDLVLEGLVRGLIFGGGDTEGRDLDVGPADDVRVIRADAGELGVITFAAIDAWAGDPPAIAQTAPFKNSCLMLLPARRTY